MLTREMDLIRNLGYLLGAQRSREGGPGDEKSRLR